MKEFREFTRSLGERLATCVSQSGNVQHLYSRGPHLLLVYEALSFIDGDGVSRDLWSALQEFRCTLHEFVKTTPARFHRVFDFEPVSDNCAALWAMEARVADGLPDWVRNRLWRELEEGVVDAPAAAADLI